jgi:hypothetical protein
LRESDVLCFGHREIHLCLDSAGEDDGALGVENDPTAT